VQLRFGVAVRRAGAFDREIAGGLAIEGTCTTDGDAEPELHGVARELVEILADEYALGRENGARTFRLVKYLKDGD